ETGQVGRVEDLVLDGHGGDRAVEIVAAAVPDDAGAGDVALLGGVDGPEVTHALAVLGVLAHAHVDLVLPDHRGGDDLVGGAAAAQDVLGARWVGVELPDQVAGLGLERVDPSVAAGEDDLGTALDHRVGRVRPGAVEDLRAGQLVLPDELPGGGVQGDEAGRVGRGDADVALVHAVAGGRVEQAVYDQRRADGQVVREDVQLPHQVELPHHVAVDLARVLLVGLGPVVLAVAEAFGVKAHDGGPVRRVVEPVPLGVGGGADALLRPVVDAPGGQLLVRHLPEEVAGVGLEGHDHTAVLGQLRGAQPVVVCAAAPSHAP